MRSISVCLHWQSQTVLSVLVVSSIVRSVLVVSSVVLTTTSASRKEVTQTVLSVLVVSSVVLTTTSASRNEVTQTVLSVLVVSSVVLTTTSASRKEVTKILVHFYLTRVSTFSGRLRRCRSTCSRCVNIYSYPSPSLREQHSFASAVRSRISLSRLGSSITSRFTALFRRLTIVGLTHSSLLASCSWQATVSLVSNCTRIVSYTKTPIVFLRTENSPPLWLLVPLSSAELFPLAALA